MLSNSLKYSPFTKWALIFLPTLFFSASALAEIEITVTLNHPSPLIVDIGEEGTFLHVDARFSDSRVQKIFLHIPDKPDFFTFWREREFNGPADYIWDKIIFKPGCNDAGRHAFKIVAGAVDRDGMVFTDTLDFEVRVKPFILDEPEFAGGTSNTIFWKRSKNLFDKWIFMIDPNSPGG